MEATAGAAGFECSALTSTLVTYSSQESLINCAWRVSQPRYKEEPLIAIGRTIILDHRFEESPPIATRGIPDTFRYLYRSLIDPTGHHIKRQSRYVVDHEDVNRSVELEEKRYFDLSVQRVLQSRCFFSGYIGVGPLLPYFWEEICNLSLKTNPGTIHLLGKLTCMGL